MKENQAKELNEQIQSVMEAEDWLGALELAESNAPLVRANWDLSWNVAWAFFKLNRLREAREHLLRAAKLAPQNASCHWALGQVYQLLGNYRKAEACLIQSLNIRDSHTARINLALTYLTQGKTDRGRTSASRGDKTEAEGSGEVRILFSVSFGCRPRGRSRPNSQ
jgi:tetratricopeptide (TPR) repeat protein